jgi:hypothetical protein
MERSRRARRPPRTYEESIEHIRAQGAFVPRRERMFSLTIQSPHQVQPLQNVTNCFQCPFLAHHLAGVLCQCLPQYL